MKWAAVNYCTKRVLNNNGGYDNEYQLYPYLIEADSYAEAVGKAALVLQKLKKQCPGQHCYDFKVNSLGEAGVIVDPKLSYIYPEE